MLDRSAYAKNFENYFEWLMYVCAVVYVVPQGETKRDIQIAAGAISMFLGWINFSLFLKGFTSLGIYIIMAKRVFLTVCKVQYSNNYEWPVYIDLGSKRQLQHTSSKNTTHVLPE